MKNFIDIVYVMHWHFKARLKHLNTFAANV